jgi:SOS-response transcriptional repressor LexA
MLKYVKLDFQISDLKQVIWLSLRVARKTKVIFKKLNVKSNGMFLEPLNPKWHEKIIELRKECKLTGKVVGLYRDI